MNACVPMADPRYACSIVYTRTQFMQTNGLTTRTPTPVYKINGRDAHVMYM